MSKSSSNPPVGAEKGLLFMHMDDPTPSRQKEVNNWQNSGQTFKESFWNSLELTKHQPLFVTLK